MAKYQQKQIIQQGHYYSPASIGQETLFSRAVSFPVIPLVP
jgi:hypothetical protein